MRPRIHPIATIGSTGASGPSASTIISASPRTIGGHHDCSSQAKHLSIRAQRVLLPVIVTILCVSLGWTVWLILLTIFPDYVVNFATRTQDFDSGTFWGIIDPPDPVLAMGVSGLTVVLAGYLFVGLEVVAWGKRAIIPLQLLAVAQNVPSTIIRRLSRSRGSSASAPAPQGIVPSSVLHPVAEESRPALTSRKLFVVAGDLRREDSLTRKYANVCFKLGNLLAQLLVVYTSMESGFPAILIRPLALSVVANSLACVAIIYSPWEVSRLEEDLIDFMFDLTVAVGFPISVLGYCLATFDLDRDALAINQDVFDEGDFLRLARVVMDPVNAVIVYKGFVALRIYTLLDFASRVGSNLILCYRFHCVVALLRDPRRHQASLYPRRHPIAIVFVLFALATTVFVEESMRRTQQACAPHPECVIYAHRWSTRSLDDGSGRNQCPCKVVIDNEKAPTTYEQWTDPPNVTTTLAKLSASGDLEAVQLINRLLPMFPEELRRCKNLRYISLMHTQTQTLQPWFKELTALEYLHIEGSPGLPGLQSLPDGLFDDMSMLTFLHIGVHEALSKLPSLQRLVNLRTLTLALLGSLREISAFNDNSKLKVLEVIEVPLLEAFPDLTPVSTTLRQFVYGGRGMACCNDFLGSGCDLDNPRCGYEGIWGHPAATCLPSNRTDRTATPATIELLEKFWASTCGSPYQLPGSQRRSIDEVVKEADVQACNGTKYRECALSTGNGTGMCYNTYFLPILCSTRPQLIDMRRRQISQGVGEACDPKHEAWLGCEVA